MAKKISPPIPTSHMDASYKSQLVKLSEELGLQYEQLAELEATKQPFTDEAKEILELETTWNNLVKMAVMDRSERKRCMIS